MQPTVAICLAIMLIIDNVFGMLMNMKLKYILTTLRVEYSTFRLHVTFLSTDCVIAAEILS